MPSGGISGARRSTLLAAMAVRGWTRVGEAEWNVLSAEVAGLSTSDIRSAGIPADAPWYGVSQQSFEELDRSLRAIGEVYAARPDLRRFCRDEVIRAKDHARLASRNRRLDEAKRAAKAEMVGWMLVWLGDPAMYPAWAAARSRHARVAQIGWEPD